MARPRAASVPVKEGANPFWSSRAQEELLVQAARPEDLPVPETPSPSVTARRSRQSESGGEGSGRIRYEFDREVRRLARVGRSQ